MSITSHLAFVRKFGDKTAIITIVDSSQMEDIPDESFVMATTQRSIYSNMLPCMTFNKFETFQDLEKTQGMGLGGLLTEPLWFTRTVKDPLMGGLIREEKDTSIKDK